MRSFNHISLFNGIGGFQLAAHWNGWNNVAHCEIDKWCNSVVAKHFPESICYTDIKQFNTKQYEGSVDIISGGFPCQPFSVAGKQKGKSDDRYLWKEMLRIITEVKPTYVVGENVAGIIGLALDEVLTDLENEGYTTETFIIPACAVGAWHRRDRVWIVAHSESKFNDERGYRQDSKEGQIQWEVRGSSSVSPNPTKQGLQNGRRSSLANTGEAQQESKRLRGNAEQLQTTSNTRSERCKKLNTPTGSNQSGFDTRRTIEEWPKWEAESPFCGVADGIPRRMDRLRGLGNAIVPQVAFEIFKAINKIHKSLYDTK